MSNNPTDINDNSRDFVNNPTEPGELPDDFLELCAYTQLTSGQARQVLNYIARSNLDAREDELSKIPVIQTTGVGYEVIVSHRMDRLREIFDARDAITSPTTPSSEEDSDGDN